MSTGHGKCSPISVDVNETSVAERGSSVLPPFRESSEQYVMIVLPKLLSHRIRVNVSVT